MNNAEMAALVQRLRESITAAARDVAAVSSPDCRCQFKRGVLVKLCALCQAGADRIDERLWEVLQPVFADALTPRTQEPMSIPDELHEILTRYGIASRSLRDGMAGLPDDLVQWAADACRQSIEIMDADLVGGDTPTPRTQEPNHADRENVQLLPSGDSADARAMSVLQHRWEATGMLVKTGPDSATNTGDEVRAYSLVARHNEIVDALTADRQRLTEALDIHTAAVAAFLNELYAIMVDPLAEGPITVAKMMIALRNAAIRDRDAENALATLTAERDALQAALRDVLAGFDEGYFVRSVAQDHRPDWALRLAPHVAALARASRLLNKEGSSGD